MYIAEVKLVGGPEIDITEHAGEAEHVLVFKVGAVGILIDLGGEQVLAILEIRRDVQFGRRAGVL